MTSHLQFPPSFPPRRPVDWTLTPPSFLPPNQNGLTLLLPQSTSLAAAGLSPTLPPPPPPSGGGEGEEGTPNDE
ncbi:hypothetical protein PBY51_008427 [Eleginops maclovinus]|uniref:Uncharacterized protein n=1 Tax=Eleginops maclovinus TaxID=56733 RepID=A0AAN7X3C3_ELEMC|nr:hypothetical protein PBY51_008427 [Eleginops maclovinus]